MITNESHSDIQKEQTPLSQPLFSTWLNKRGYKHRCLCDDFIKHNESFNQTVYFNLCVENGTTPWTQTAKQLPCFSPWWNCCEADRGEKMPRSKPQPVITVFDDYSFQYCTASSQPPHHTMTAGALSTELPRSVLHQSPTRADYLSSPLFWRTRARGMKLKQLSVETAVIAHSNRQNHERRYGIRQSTFAFLKLNLELAPTFPGLQDFNKRAVLKQIRTKTEKKRNNSCLFSLFIQERKKTWDHIRQENNAHSL